MTKRLPKGIKLAVKEIASDATSSAVDTIYEALDDEFEDVKPMVRVAIRDYAVRETIRELRKWLHKKRKKR